MPAPLATVAHVSPLVRPWCFPLLLVGLAHGQEAPEPVLLHNGVPATPGADLSFAHDRLRLHPYVLAAIGGDDNPLQRPAGSPSDHFGEAAIGCVAELRDGGHRLDVTGAIFHRDYETVSGRELSGGSFATRYLREGPTSRLSARAKWDRSDDPSVEIGRSLERDRITGGVGVAKLGEFTRLDTELRAHAVDYREDSPEFASHERDHAAADWSVGVRRAAGDDAEVGMRAAALAGRYLDERSPYHDHAGLRGEGLVQIGIGQRARVGGSLGMEARRY